MTRRLLLVLGIVLAVLVSAPGTASAAFVARASTPLTATTITVAPATAATTSGSTLCVPGVTTNYTVRISWTASPTPRVVGYQVIETVNNVARPVATIAGTTASRSATKTRNTTASHTFSVVAVTDYGWTSPVAATASFTC